MSGVRDSHSSPERLAAVVRRQHGVFSRRQALEVGFTASQIQQRLGINEWRRIEPGVYRITTHGRSWHQDVMARVLWAGNGAVASHRTAGVLWKLDGFDRGPVEISVPRSRQSGRGVHRKTDLAKADTTWSDGIPVTTPARTLIDLASVVSAGRVEAAMESALRSGLTSVDQIQRRLDRLSRRGRRGLAVMRALLAQRQARPPTDSLLETRFLQALRHADLPEPVRQHRVYVGGRLIARVDLAYPERRLFIELDGWTTHSALESFVADRRRQNRLVALGWQPLRFTWEDVTTGIAAAIGVVRAALTA